MRGPEDQTESLGHNIEGLMEPGLIYSAYLTHQVLGEYTSAFVSTTAVGHRLTGKWGGTRGATGDVNRTWRQRACKLIAR